MKRNLRKLLKINKVIRHIFGIFIIFANPSGSLWTADAVLEGRMPIV